MSELKQRKSDSGIQSRKYLKSGTIKSDYNRRIAKFTLAYLYDQ
jgi:hypothetical protein